MLKFVDNYLEPITLSEGETAASLSLPDGEYLLTLADSQTAATRWEIIGAVVTSGEAVLTRGLQGTTDQAWPAGSVIYCALTAETLQSMGETMLEMMTAIGVKVDQSAYDAFAASVTAALADRYTKGEADAAFDQAGAAAGAVSDHEAAPDPHPQYLTQDRGDVRYDALGAAALRIALTEKAVAGGVATLDGNAKVPLNQINDAVLGQMSYQGLWDAATNTPTLPAAPAQKGDYYVTSAPGTQFGLTFATGDWLVANGAAWGKVDNTDAVSTVQGRTGNVVITKADLDIEETYTLAEKNKLAGVAAGATANATNAELRDRATHTGTQAISTVSGLQSALDTIDAELGDTESALTTINAALAAIIGE